MEKELEEVVADLILKTIQNADIRAIYFKRDGLTWNAFSRNLLRLALDSEVITEDEVLQEIESELRRQARICFGDCVKRDTEADHTAFPEALAYALRVKEFTGIEIDRIPFDVDMTLSRFISRYEGNKNLPKIILERLLE